MPEPTDHSFSPFSHFDPEVPMPLSAADIRRRGDRLRRRNTALAVVGGVAAIALIATPLALVAGGGDNASIAPTTQGPTVTDAADPPTLPPSSPPPTEPTSVPIPAGFPLGDGMPDTNGSDGSAVEVLDEPAISSFAPCDDSLWSPVGPVASTLDVAGVSYAGEAEDFRSRTLALYSSDDDAVAALQAIRDGLAACAVDTVSGTDQVYEEVSRTDDESVVTLRFRTEQGFDLGLTVFQFHRAGNALLLASYYGEGGGSDETIASSVDLASRESAGVYAAMSDAFESEGAVGASGSPAALALTDLPGRQRLDAWTEVEATAPVLACVPTGYDLPSVASAFEAGASADPAGVGTPIAQLRTVVYSFDSADAAAGGFAEVSTALDTCPELLGISPGQQGDASGLGGDRADWQQFTYSDPEICTDCDGVRFDHMGVAQVGNRLVLLSYAEFGGPLEPKNMDTFMREVLAKAISLA